MKDPEQNIVIECELEVSSDDWSQAAAFLADHLPLSKSRVKEAMNAGAVWHCRGKQRERLRRARAELLPGDRVQVFYNEALVRMPAWDLRPLADEGHYSVWNKPAGMLYQGDDWGDRHAFERQVHLYFDRQREVYPVHEIDRESGGLVLLAHDRRTAAALAESFAPDQPGVDGNIDELAFVCPLSGEQKRYRLT